MILQKEQVLERFNKEKNTIENELKRGKESRTRMHSYPDLTMSRLIY